MQRLGLDTSEIDPLKVLVMMSRDYGRPKGELRFVKEPMESEEGKN